MMKRVIIKNLSLKVLKFQIQQKKLNLRINN